MLFPLPETKNLRINIVNNEMSCTVQISEPERY